MFFWDRKMMNKKEILIQANKLHKYYKNGQEGLLHVINDTTISFERKGLVCLLGESGSGKTTLLNTLGGIDNFKSGSIQVDDVLISGKMDRKTENLRNEKYGYVFQNYYLLMDATVYENLHIAMGIFDISEEEKEERINYVLNAIDMSRFKKRPVTMLSGGQQQRVAIARALLRTPSVIFADEPTGNLDEANTLRIMGILKEVSKHCLVILATHDKRIADFFADRIIRIQNGKIVDDKQITGDRTYYFSDDKNFYLSEFQKVELAGYMDSIRNKNTIKDKNEIKNNEIKDYEMKDENFKTHSDLESEEKSKVQYYAKEDEPLTLTVIRENGQLYVKSPRGEHIEVLGQNVDIQLIETERKPIGLDQMNELDYNLKILKAESHIGLVFKEVWRQAIVNISKMKQKLILPCVIMLITAILVTIAVSDYKTLSTINKQDFINTDSRYLKVTVERADGSPYSVFSSTFKEFTRYFEENVPGNTQLYASFNAVSHYYYEGVEQIEDMSDTFYGFSYVPLDYLKEEDLIHGRMPIAPNEVVVDRWVLENFMDRETILSKSITDITTFLNQEIEIEKKNYSLVIVGICDAGNPSLYVDKIAGLGIAIGGTLVASLESLQKLYPEYKDVKLGSHEVLVNEQVQGTSVINGKFRTMAGLEYEVAGDFPSEFPVRFVIAEDSYSEMLMTLIHYCRIFSVFTDDKEAVKQFIDELPEEYTNYMRIRVEDRYTEQMATYEEARTQKLDARVIVTIMILLMSFVVLYISMKSNGIQNMNRICVFRILGVSKSSILWMYGIQIILLSFFTTVLGTLTTAGVLLFVSNIPYLEINFVVTGASVMITGVALLLVNLITGLLPITRFLRIPLAQLSTIYDF